MIGPTEPLMLRMADGRLIGPISGPPMESGSDVEIRPLAGIGPRIFDRCPICFDSATDDEHVPPESIGGVEMTKTCNPCNNRFGSLVEPDLLNWLDGAMLSAKLRSDLAGDRPGSMERLGLRLTPDGGFVLLADGGPHLREVLNRGGEMNLRWRSIDYRRCWIALLKQAYLAACLAFGIPMDPLADAIRAELVAVRSLGRRREQPPPTPLAERLLVAAHPEPVAVLPPVVAAEAVFDVGPVPGVLLVGRVFVGWAFGPERKTPMGEPVEFSMPITIGAPMDGITVAA